VLAEIETDKAIMEIEAVDEGTLGKILVAEGTEEVAVNSVIAMILEEGEGQEALDLSAQEQVPPPPTLEPTPDPTHTHTGTRTGSCARCGAIRRPGIGKPPGPAHGKGRGHRSFHHSGIRPRRADHQT
jgi:pyruvate dehydrogenase E2 component (dihydrolipoamide acetyltransferase)